MVNVIHKLVLDLNRDIASQYQNYRHRTSLHSANTCHFHPNINEFGGQSHFRLSRNEYECKGHNLSYPVGVYLLKHFI